ncbi:hypothetical protein [Sediminicoccus rosea]|uniref:Uncharacterized protein n=1 Tax=Sediminicoccus rosea TaxID=1225128 RepID=A0ABZ0PD16_9PROT|nr:hypothetical protein [Sediminicoccus rosea]WPB83095.1 hypothetical protein R9Z33_13370 [Sediminicoccus rosea]
MQEPMEGAVFTRIFAAHGRGEGPALQAIVWRDTFAHPFYVTVSAPGLLVRPVRARLGFRSAGQPVARRDLALAGVVLRRGEEVGASFPTFDAVKGFLRDLWAIA